MFCLFIQLQNHFNLKISFEKTDQKQVLIIWNGKKILLLDATIFKSSIGTVNFKKKVAKSVHKP